MAEVNAGISKGLWATEVRHRGCGLTRAGRGQSAAPADRPGAQNGNRITTHRMNFTLCTGSNRGLWSAFLAVYLKSLFAHRLLYVFEGLVVIEEVLSTNHVHLEDKTERRW